MKRFFPLWFCLLSVFVFGGTTLARGQALEATPVSTTLKFEPEAYHGGPIIEVLINGSVPARFLLDTGASFSCIRKDVAEKLKLPDAGLVQTLDGLFQTVKLKHLYVGAWEVSCEAIVIGEPALAAWREDKIDGILGLETLQEWAMFLNFERQEVTLFQSGNLSPSMVARLGYHGGEAVPTFLAFDAEKLHYYVDVTLPGRTVPLIVDTGEFMTTFPNEVAKALPGKFLYEQSRLNITGTRQTPIYVSDGVTVGKTKGARQVVGVAKEKDNHSRVLGMDFWAQFNVLLDFPARRLYLHRLSASNPSLDANRQLDIEGMVIRADAGQWKVVTLDASNRLLRAGLRPGDIIDALNQTSIRGLLSEQMVPLIASKTVAFHISRIVNGKTEHRIVTVKSR